MHHNKLNIGIIGYGKMGKIIEKLLIDRGHDIVLRTNSTHPLESQLPQLQSVDVAIEFTTPELAPKNLTLLAENKISTICGSTAWLSDYESVSQKFIDNECGFLYASNFSIGVNIFFQINQQLAKLMNQHAQYDVTIHESHHTEKKDAPSGTAVTIANQVIDALERKRSWTIDPATQADQLQITASREADVKGFHELSYTSPIDQIKMSHEAYSREGFALGAILAAEWIHGKKGIYSMKDVLGI